MNEPEPIEGEVISIFESPNGQEPKIYTVKFHPTQPTQEGVDEAVEMLEIFSQVKCSFHLHADMREGNMTEQIKYAWTYGKLIGKIANENCHKCLVMLPESKPSAARSFLIKTITFIVSSLGVEIEIR